MRFSQTRRFAANEKLRKAATTAVDKAMKKYKRMIAAEYRQELIDAVIQDYKSNWEGEAISAADVAEIAGASGIGEVEEEFSFKRNSHKRFTRPQSRPRPTHRFNFPVASVEEGDPDDFPEFAGAETVFVGTFDEDDELEVAVADWGNRRASVMHYYNDSRSPMNLEDVTYQGKYMNLRVAREIMSDYMADVETP